MAVKKGDLLIRIDDRDYRAAPRESRRRSGGAAGRAGRYPGYPPASAGDHCRLCGLLLAATAATENWLTTTDAITPWPPSAISAQIRDNASADYRRAHAEQEKAKADKTVAERQLAVLDARQQQIPAARRRPGLTSRWPC